MLAIQRSERRFERQSVLQSRVKRLEKRVTELEVQLEALLHPKPTDYDAPFNTIEECANGTCSYHDLYLATGPADMSHAAYHGLERQAADHFERCGATEHRCSTCRDYDKRARA